MVSGELTSSELAGGDRIGEKLRRAGTKAAAGAAEIPSPAEGRNREALGADGIWIKHAPIQRTLYWCIHAACLLGFWFTPSVGDLALFAATFFVRMFAITGAYHRYFSHRTYRTSRVFQFILALLGTSAVQKGPLWWAANHRVHHRRSDQPGDPHSPREGVWHSHQGWIFEKEWGETRLEEIRDLTKFPELVWLNQWHVVGPILLGLSCFAIGGWSGFIWGFAISTTAAWHVTYSINSLSHIWGTRRYETDDDSRNNLLLALLTLGEGWHNNHHFHQSSVRQGFYWWEIDITYYILRGLSALGIVWDLKLPPKRAYETTATKPAGVVS